MAAHLLSAVENSIGFVILNKPDTGNAITTDMFLALPKVLADLAAASARVIVLSGQGDHFAAGADLNELQRLKDYDAAAGFWAAIENCLNFVAGFDLPVIAMIHGACLGGGCLLATACDLRIAAHQSSFGVPIARLGILLDDVSIARLVSLVGHAFARLMLYTACTISGAEADKIGLVDNVYDRDDLERQVMLVAQSIAKSDALVVREMKRSINRIQANISGNTFLTQQREQIIKQYCDSGFQERLRRNIMASN